MSAIFNLEPFKNQEVFLKDLRILTENNEYKKDKTEMGSVSEKLALVDEKIGAGLFFLDEKSAVSAKLETTGETKAKYQFIKLMDTFQKFFRKDSSKPYQESILTGGEIRKIKSIDFPKFNHFKGKYPNLADLFMDMEVAKSSELNQYTTIGKIAKAAGEFAEFQNEINQAHSEKLKKENMVKQGYKTLFKAGDK